MKGRSNEILRDPLVADVISGAKLCHVAVQSKFGPHVTPEAFSTARGRLWFVTSIRSLKTRAIRLDPRVGVLLRAGERSLSFSGRAEILSMWSPGEGARLFASALPAWEAVGSYGVRNIGIMLGYALDLGTLSSGTLPIDRVLVAVRPESASLIEEDEVVETWGEWTHRPRLKADMGSADPFTALGEKAIEDLPTDLSILIADPENATVGLPSATGPVALPASWDLRRRVAKVPGYALRATRAPAGGPSCITLDSSPGVRPTRYRGVMLRGEGRRGPSSARRVDVTVDVERVTWWRGFRTGTLPVARDRRTEDRRVLSRRAR